jgi:hypothetical protein
VDGCADQLPHGAAQTIPYCLCATNLPPILYPVCFCNIWVRFSAFQTKKKRGKYGPTCTTSWAKTLSGSTPFTGLHSCSPQVKPLATTIVDVAFCYVSYASFCFCFSSCCIITSLSGLPLPKRLTVHGHWLSGGMKVDACARVIHIELNPVLF